MQHYNLTSAATNSYIGNSLNDLNSGDDITDPTANDVADDNDDRSSAVVSVSFRLLLYSCSICEAPNLNAKS